MYLNVYDHDIRIQRPLNGRRGSKSEPKGHICSCNSQLARAKFFTLLLMEFDKQAVATTAV